MFTIPEWKLKSTPAEDLDELLEWRLAAHDVQAMMGVTAQAVSRWATIGYHGEILPSRRFSFGPRAPRAFRLYDVRRFAQRVDKRLDLTKLHPVLAKQWGVDIDNPAIDAKVDEHGSD